MAEAKVKEKVQKKSSVFWKLAIAVVIFAVVIALIAKNSQNEKVSLPAIADKLIEQEKKYECVGLKHVAVGYGACQDLYVDGSYLFENFKAPNEVDHYSYISTQEELLKMYAYFFQHGAAAERFVSNDSLFEEIVKIAKSSPNKARYTLGGNAPVMAERMAKGCCKILLAAMMTKDLEKWLPKGIKVVGGVVDVDDLHLLIEYKVGDVWGKYVAPRANRFIIHSDNNNPMVQSLNEFDDHLKEFDADLLVVGGLQMMDSYPFPQGVRKERLSSIASQLSKQPLKTRIHFEMASFSDGDLVGEILDYVIPYADSLGMNEQELPNLHSMLLYKNISLVSDSNPRIATVLDTMRDLYNRLGDRSEVEGKRKLTRLHVHTLAYQVIMSTKGSSWINNKIAAATASLRANRHTCGNEEINALESKLLLDESFSLSAQRSDKRMYFNVTDPVTCWNESMGQDTVVEICLAPVLVCTKVVQTAGAGDNISAAALAVQI